MPRTTVFAIWRPSRLLMKSITAPSSSFFLPDDLGCGTGTGGGPVGVAGSAPAAVLAASFSRADSRSTGVAYFDHSDESCAALSTPAASTAAIDDVGGRIRVHTTGV